MTQHLTFPERLRSVLPSRPSVATKPAADRVARSVSAGQDKGLEFAQRLRAAIPRQQRRPR